MLVLVIAGGSHPQDAAGIGIVDDGDRMRRDRAISHAIVEVDGVVAGRNADDLDALRLAVVLRRLVVAEVRRVQEIDLAAGRHVVQDLGAGTTMVAAGGHALAGEVDLDRRSRDFVGHLEGGEPVEPVVEDRDLDASSRDPGRMPGDGGRRRAALGGDHIRQLLADRSPHIRHPRGPARHIPQHRDRDQSLDMVLAGADHGRIACHQHRGHVGGGGGLLAFDDYRDLVVPHPHAGTLQHGQRRPDALAGRAVHRVDQPRLETPGQQRVPRDPFALHLPVACLQGPVLPDGLFQPVGLGGKTDRILRRSHACLRTGTRGFLAGQGGGGQQACDHECPQPAQAG